MIARLPWPRRRLCLMSCNNHSYLASVCLSDVVCLPVSNYWPDRHENFTSDVSVDKEELTKFRKYSASGSRSRNFSKESSTLQERTFGTIWLTALEKLIGSSIKCYHTCIWQGALLNFGNHPDLQSGSGWIRFVERSVLSEWSCSGYNASRLPWALTNINYYC